MNEAVFTIYGVRFHLPNENPEYFLFAPKEDTQKSMWINVLVPDIQACFEKAKAQGCTVIQPVTEMKEMGVSNAVFSDKFGYIWMIHQIHRVVSFEERV